MALISYRNSSLQPDNYCPYCDRDDVRDSTEEHVIPQSIGGDSRTVINVCERCNSTAGSTIDTKISGNEWLRLNALFAGSVASRHEQLSSTTTLKDGRKLEGHFFFRVTDRGVVIDFQPKKTQSDGSKWLSENVKTDLHSLPADINILRRDMVEYWGIDCTPDSLVGLQAAFIKILLGIIYMDQGQPVVSQSAFDTLRSCLDGTLHDDVIFVWMNERMKWGSEVVRNDEHAVYFECPEGKLFKAGVSIFGISAAISIESFGCVLPKRCTRWQGRPRHNAT